VHERGFPRDSQIAGVGAVQFILRLRRFPFVRGKSPGLRCVYGVPPFDSLLRLVWARWHRRGMRASDGVVRAGHPNGPDHSSGMGIHEEEHCDAAYSRGSRNHRRRGHPDPHCSFYGLSASEREAMLQQAGQSQGASGTSWLDLRGGTISSWKSTKAASPKTTEGCCRAGDGDDPEPDR